MATDVSDLVKHSGADLRPTTSITVRVFGSLGFRRVNRFSNSLFLVGNSNPLLSLVCSWFRGRSDAAGMLDESAQNGGLLRLPGSGNFPPSVPARASFPTLVNSLKSPSTQSDQNNAVQQLSGPACPANGSGRRPDFIAPAHYSAFVVDQHFADDQFHYGLRLAEGVFHVI
jgi:hypothetical protein